MCYSCRHARGPYTVQQSPGRPASWNPGARWTQRPRTAHLLEISRVAQIAIQYKLIISIATTHSTLAHTGCMGASLHTAKPRGGIVARTRHGCTQTRSSTQARTSGQVARSQLSAWVQCMPIAPAQMITKTQNRELVPAPWARPCLCGLVWVCLCLVLQHDNWSCFPVPMTDLTLGGAWVLWPGGR